MLLSDVVSPFCACLCDDLTLLVQDGKLIPQSDLCPSAAERYQAVNDFSGPPAKVGDQKSSYEEAVQAAHRVLQESRAPLVFGMSGMGTNSHRAAILFAERWRGVIDSGTGPLSRATLSALQRTGLSTCSLGEIKNRADLILIWGADPVKTHPRLLQRLKVNASRSVIVVDTQRTATAELASEFIQVPAASQLETLLALRMLTRRPDVIPQTPVGVNISRLQSLAQRLKQCHYGVALCGESLLQGPLPDRVLGTLVQLVDDLCSHTRFAVRPLGKPSAESVLAWQTGFAGVVSFQSGAPAALHERKSASDLLENGEADCAVILGSSSLKNLSAAARRSLATVPTILIEPIGETAGDIAFQPDILIQTAVDGIHTRDSINRWDDVPLPLRPLISATFPTVSDVLRRLLPVN